MCSGNLCRWGSSVSILSSLIWPGQDIQDHYTLFYHAHHKKKILKRIKDCLLIQHYNPLYSFNLLQNFQWLYFFHGCTHLATSFLGYQLSFFSGLYQITYSLALWHLLSVSNAQSVRCIVSVLSIMSVCNRQSICCLLQIFC